MHRALAASGPRALARASHRTASRTSLPQPLPTPASIAPAAPGPIATAAPRLATAPPASHSQHGHNQPPRALGKRGRGERGKGRPRCSSSDGGGAAPSLPRQAHPSAPALPRGRVCCTKRSRCAAIAASERPQVMPGAASHAHSIERASTRARARRREIVRAEPRSTARPSRSAARAAPPLHAGGEGRAMRATPASP